MHSGAVSQSFPNVLFCEFVRRQVLLRTFPGRILAACLPLLYAPQQEVRQSLAVLFPSRSSVEMRS